MVIRIIKFEGWDTKLEKFLSENLQTQRKLVNFYELSKIEHHFSNTGIPWLTRFQSTGSSI